MDNRDDPHGVGAAHSRVEGQKDDGAGRAGLRPGDPVAQGLAVKRREAIAAGAHYRRDWLDAGYWDELAKARGLRLPPWHQGCTPALMKRWLRTLGVSVQAYLSWSGHRALKDFAAANPAIGLRPWVGFLLETLESGVLTTEPAGETGAQPEERAARAQVPGTVCCTACGASSGITGKWKRSPALVAKLRTLGWACLHCGHLAGMDADPRGWFCAHCAPSVRQGRALADAQRLHGSAQHQAKQERLG